MPEEKKFLYRVEIGIDGGKMIGGYGGANSPREAIESCLKANWEKLRESDGQILIKYRVVSREELKKHILSRESPQI